MAGISKLSAHISLANELSFQLVVEYLAERAPGFAGFYTAQADQLIATGNLAAQAQEALQDMRDHVAFIAEHRH